MQQELESHARALRVLIVRGRDAQTAAFEQRAMAVAARYRDSVACETLGCDELATLHPELDLPWHGASKMLILRGDHLIGQATGTGLPTRELDRALRRAVDTCH